MKHLIVQMLVETLHEKQVETGILETYLGCQVSGIRLKIIMRSHRSMEALGTLLPVSMRKHHLKQFQFMFTCFLYILFHEVDNFLCWIIFNNSFHELHCFTHWVVFALAEISGFDDCKKFIEPCTIALILQEVLDSSGCLNSKGNFLEFSTIFFKF